MNETELALLEAFNNITIEHPIIEHRIYFDSVTGRCTIKTTANEPGEYIVVSREEYDAVEFCPNWFVTNTNKLRKIKIEYRHEKQLQLSTTGFSAIADCNIFALDEEPECSHWNKRIAYE